MIFSTKEELATKLEAIDGFLRREEAYLLYRIALTLPGEAVAAEIGSWMGRSSTAIAFALQERGGLLHTIDDHRGITGHEGAFPAERVRGAFLQNVQAAGVAALIEHHPFSSDALAPAWRTQLDFLFIDGDHRYAAVQRDIANYTPFVKKGGWIAFHDTGGAEVARAIKEWAATEQIGIAGLCRAGTIFALRLPGPNARAFSKPLTQLLWKSFDAAAREIPPQNQWFRKQITKLQKSFARRLLRFLSPPTLR